MDGNPAMGSDEENCLICKTKTNDELNLGELKRLGRIRAHYYCLLLATTIAQSGEDNEGILGFLEQDIYDEIARARTRLCVYCKKYGATVLCHSKYCKSAFHLPCGLLHGSGHQFYGRYLSHCIVHRPTQIYLKPDKPAACPICYEYINFEKMLEVLWAPCCKTSYFHKSCIQQLALSAGYFFKCPMCNDTNIFPKTMKHHGVFVPDQDASWELEPNAYQELLERHNVCNVVHCLSAKGRKYSRPSGLWSLVLCKLCGSQGTHMTCSHLKRNEEWQCSVCISAANNQNRIKLRQNTGENTNTTANKIAVPIATTAVEMDIAEPQPSTSRGLSENLETNLAREVRKRKRGSSAFQLDVVPCSGAESNNMNIISPRSIPPEPDEIIEIDSDDDSVSRVPDEPVKCFITENGSILKVNKVIVYEKVEAPQMETGNGNSDTENGLLVSDVASVTDPTAVSVCRITHNGTLYLKDNGETEIYEVEEVLYNKNPSTKPKPTVKDYVIDEDVIVID